MDEELVYPATQYLELGIYAEPQKSAEWCWASCAVGVCRFLKLEKIPTEGDLANMLTGRKDCNIFPTPKECVRPAQALEITAIYDALGIARLGPDAPLTQNTLLNELLAGSPVEIGYLWYQGGGHVALVRGFKFWPGTKILKFNISDPFFGNSDLSYAELVLGYGVGRWTYSYGRFARKK